MRKQVPEIVQSAMQQIPPEALATLHRYYFGDPEEDAEYIPIESELRAAGSWAMEGGCSDHETRAIFLAASFIEELFRPIRTYGLAIPDPDAVPTPTPEAA